MFSIASSNLVSSLLSFEISLKERRKWQYVPGVEIFSDMQCRVYFASNSYWQISVWFLFAFQSSVFFEEVTNTASINAFS